MEFMFEMRAAVSRGQVELLRAAGMTGAQLGIETFSTPLLRLINKGTTALQNLQTLKWLSEAGMTVEWNLLYGFPGEDPAEYAALAELLPSLYHLTPPQGCGRVRSDRFSPYFTHPEEYGIANLRPSEAFAYVFPFPRDALARAGVLFRLRLCRRPPSERLRGSAAGTDRRLARPGGQRRAANVRPRRRRAADPRHASRRGRLPASADGSRPRRVSSLRRRADAGKQSSTAPPVSILKRPTKPRCGGCSTVGSMARIMARVDDRYLSLALRTAAEP